MTRVSPTAGARYSSLLRVAAEKLAWPVDIVDVGAQQQSRTTPHVYLDGAAYALRSCPPAYAPERSAPMPCTHLVSETGKNSCPIFSDSHVHRMTNDRLSLTAALRLER